MQISIRLTYRSTRKEFVISTKTKPTTLQALARKALHLSSDIRQLRAQDGSKVSLQELIAQGRGGQFQALLDDQSSEQRSRSQGYSQKALSRVSGRRNPPSENELLDSKFYIDDFQLFMSEVSGPKTQKLFGIVFFSNKKKAVFLGKKILRQLIFQFDKIEFFYALHPIKMHTSSALLGDLLVFTLFRGKNMIHQRQFPQQITAADQILNYVKNLVKMRQLIFGEQPKKEQKKPKNLIKVQEQRSFDHKLEISPQKLSDFGGKPNRTAELIKKTSVSPDLESKKIFQNARQESPIRSQITNEISFENDLFQPEWFSEGNELTRLEKAFLSALIKSNDQSLLSFMSGLNLKNKQMQRLNIKLVKVFLKELIEERLSTLTAEQRKVIEQNQENRKSFVYLAVVKLNKFGNIDQFIASLRRSFAEVKATPVTAPSPPLPLVKNDPPSTKEVPPVSVPQSHIPQMRSKHPSFGVKKTDSLSQVKRKDSKLIQYSLIAKNTEKMKMGFSIRLVDCGNDEKAASPELESPFRMSHQKRVKHTEIAMRFHRLELPPVDRQLFRDIDFGREYDQAQRAGILALCNKHDAFMMQCFLPRVQGGKKAQKMSSKIVKKYLREVQSRYDQIRERTVINSELHLKMVKLQVFNGLLYYLYKQRIINKKQLKIAFYLYTWSDLNVLGAFQLYLSDRNIQQLVDTLYAIDYNYYLHQVYQIDHAEVEQFTFEIQEQLIILFLYQTSLQSGDDRISLEKFIRAGDIAVLKLYRNQQLNDSELVQKIIELSKNKKEELDHIKQGQNILEVEIKEKKKERCNFVDQLVSARFRNFTRKDLLNDCIMRQEAKITELLDELDNSGDQMGFMESFGGYLEGIERTHCMLVLREVVRDSELIWDKVQQIKWTILEGIYQAHQATKDTQDTIDSLQRAVRRFCKNSP